MSLQGFLPLMWCCQWCLKIGFVNLIVPVMLILQCQGASEENLPFVCTRDDQQCDTHVRCPAWKEEGECIRSQEYMNEHCPGSCEIWLDNDIMGSNDELYNSTCYDRHTDCAHWAILGECETNLDVKQYCAVSCGICESEAIADVDIRARCVDENEGCDYWASVGECDTNPNYMHQFCKKSCDACHIDIALVKDHRKKEIIDHGKTTSFGIQQIVDGAQAVEIASRILDSIAYMESDMVSQLDESVRAECQNRNELCASWAVLGECEQNSGYMQKNCAPSCMTCHLLDDLGPDCPPRDDSVKAALYPGDLNQMFRRIVHQAPGNRSDVSLYGESTISISNNTPNYTVHIHSQPETELDESTPPWVITLDEFLTEEECSAMIQLGYKYEYERSIEATDETYDHIQSDYRTSENAWCSSMRGCRNESIPARLHQRMADVLGIPPENSEDMQILKYEVGQY
jgi:prolyl 4-hydroxylase